MNKMLLFLILFASSLNAQNRFNAILPEQDPNYISLNRLQMFVIHSMFDKETEANIEVRISEKGKTLAVAEIRNYKLNIGPNTINLDQYFVPADDKKGLILKKGFKLEEGDYIISTHVSVLYDGVMSFHKDSIVRNLPDRGPIKTMMPVNEFEFEETPNVFMWEPINPVIQDANYKLSIYEVKDKMKLEDIVAKESPIFINQTNFSNQINIIGKGSIPFKRKQKYCWVITMEVGDIVLKTSEIKTFKIKNLSPEHNHEPEEPVLIDLSKPQSK